MLNYNDLINKPKDFLAITGLKIEEFEKLKEGFKEAYKKVYTEEKTKEGKERKRKGGAGVKGQLEKEEDKQASNAAEEAETKGGYYAEDYSF